MSETGRRLLDAADRLEERVVGLDTQYGDEARVVASLLRAVERTTRYRAGSVNQAGSVILTQAFAYDLADQINGVRS